MAEPVAALSMDASAEVLQLLRSLALDQYSAALFDAGLKTVKQLAAARDEDYVRLGVKIGHAREITTHAAMLDAKVQLKIERVVQALTVDPSEEELDQVDAS